MLRDVQQLAKTELNQACQGAGGVGEGSGFDTHFLGNGQEDVAEGRVGVLRVGEVLAVAVAVGLASGYEEGEIFGGVVAGFAGIQ